MIAGAFARRGFPLPDPRRRIGCVDGLRGYLALAVMVHHFIIWLQISRLGGGWAAPTVNLFNQFGAGGVALFFMTTGLVFYPLVLRGFAAASWPAIAITRVARIVPLIVASVAAVTLVIILRTGTMPGRDYPAAALQWISTWDEPPLLGYPDSGKLNAHVLWSLRFEWLFYLLVLPATAFAMDLVRGRLPSWTVPLALLLGALIVRAAQVPLAMFLYLPLFPIGMLAYELQQRGPVRRLLASRWMAIPAVAALLLGATIAPYPYGTTGLALFGFFFTCIACGNPLGGLLQTRGALVLGECSYGIYLLHGLLLNLLFVDAAAWIAPFSAATLPLVLPLIGIAVALLTAATHLAIERPAIEAGRRLARRWTDRTLRRDDPALQVAP